MPTEENKDKKSMKQLHVVASRPKSRVSQSSIRSNIKENSIKENSPTKELVKISNKLQMKMKKLKAYINKADKDFRRAKEALDSLESSARLSALKVARCSSASHCRRASFDITHDKRR